MKLLLGMITATALAIVGVVIYVALSAVSSMSTAPVSHISSANLSLWMVAGLLVVGGVVIQLWSKAPAGIKSLAGWMLTGGTFLLIVLFLFGSAAVEYRRDQVQSVAAGQDLPPPPPLSAEEQAARMERERQDAELARIKAVEAARTEAAIAEAARIAANQAADAALMNASVGPCLRRYTDQLNCNTVVFGESTKYDREAKKDHCLVSDPVDAVTRTDLGGNQYRYTGPSGLTVQFFDLPIGQTIGTFTCGQ